MPSTTSTVTEVCGAEPREHRGQRDRIGVPLLGHAPARRELRVRGEGEVVPVAHGGDLAESRPVAAANIDGHREGRVRCEGG
ncbi:hypothetical protein, partial [Microbacterium sp. 3J1]|uniref:hypothetical protein n=1 Tax=Microbacterium sp. 3J1 TaxID=861269 RepID=UPI001C4009FC